jgi:nitroreductase
VAVEAARLAPSAYNRQPWRFTTGEDFVKIAVDPGTREVQGASRRIDCGMAMAHVEIAARAAGITGRWELLDDPDVACYRAE